VPTVNAAADGIKVVATNRRAFHDYFIDEKIEAGLSLTGTEIKSIRAGRVNLRDAYASIDRGEAWLLGAHIAPYEQGNRYNHEPTRPRKLLLHRGEINSLAGKVGRSGYTLIPLQMHLTRGRAKVELGLARGKRSFDKREGIARRDAQREIERAMSVRYRERDRDR
jgi:SsrA-binding protein